MSHHFAPSQSGCYARHEQISVKPALCHAGIFRPAIKISICLGTAIEPRNRRPDLGVTLSNRLSSSFSSCAFDIPKEEYHAHAVQTIKFRQGRLSGSVIDSRDAADASGYRLAGNRKTPRRLSRRVVRAIERLVIRARYATRVIRARAYLAASLESY